MTQTPFVRNTVLLPQAFRRISIPAQDVGGSAKEYAGANKQNGTAQNGSSFEQIEEQKPCLFPPKREVMKKTGVFRNLSLAVIALLLMSGASTLPLFHYVTDMNAVVIPRQRVDLISPKDGFIVQTYVREGEPVADGELLIDVRSLEDEAALRQAEFDVNVLKRELAREETELELANLKMKEAVRLKALGSLKDQAFEEARLRLQAKRQHLDSLSQQIFRAQEQRRFLGQMLEAGRLKASFEGLVISDTGLRDQAFVREGDFLLTLASRESVIEFHLPETEAARVARGSSAEIDFYSIPDRTFRGHVEKLAHFAEPQAKHPSGERLMRIWIHCDDMPDFVRNGMTARVRLKALPKSYFSRSFFSFEKIQSLFRKEWIQ